MSSDMRFITVEPSEDILRHLYRVNTVTPYFACRIIVQAVGADENKEASVILYVTRLDSTEVAYKLANADRVYRTTARITPEGETFDVDIIIRSRNADVTGATISVSDEANRIIANE